MLLPSRQGVSLGSSGRYPLHLGGGDGAVPASIFLIKGTDYQPMFPKYQSISAL